MNSLVLNQPTMTSREIADLVESRHDHVKKSIDRLVQKQLIQLPSLREVKNHLNQTISEYVICKRDTYVIVAQLSPAFTARLVDRWQELETMVEPVFEVPKTLSGALRLAAEQAETIERQAIEIQAAQPAIEFTQAVSETQAIKIELIAKTLGYGRNTFFQMLKDDRILMHNRTPFQD